MADETDDTDAPEDEARQARHGRSCVCTALSRLRRPIVWALYCGITINDYTRPRPQSTESTVYLDATN